MSFITERDFETKTGQKKIITVVHNLERKVHELESKMNDLTKKDDILERGFGVDEQK